MGGHSGNTVELLSNGIILITKVGDQNGRTMSSLYKKINQIATELRAQNKKVLFLSDSRREGEITLGGWKAGDTVGRIIPFDKSATFGTSAVTRAKRQYITSVEGEEQRVADFDTREEAEAWLLGRKFPSEATKSVKPKFAPQTWAIFTIGDGRAMGIVLKADRSGTGEGWVYSITEPVGKHTYSVPEADISYILMGAQWVPVQTD